MLSASLNKIFLSLCYAEYNPTCYVHLTERTRSLGNQPRVNTDPVKLMVAWQHSQNLKKKRCSIKINFILQINPCHVKDGTGNNINKGVIILF